MFTGIKVKTIVLGLILASTGASALIETPALGFIADPSIVGQLNDRRRFLLTREFILMRDYDDLLRRIDDLKRRGDADSQRQLNELCSKSDSKFTELRRVRLDIRDIDYRLM